MRDVGGSAFAALAVAPNGDVCHQEGMTLRDWFAGQSLTGLLSALDASDVERLNSLGMDDAAKAAMFARHSYLQADAMLAERDACWNNGVVYSDTDLCTFCDPRDEYYWRDEMWEETSPENRP